MNSYRDLVVWQKGIELVKECYVLTKEFPKDELFGLTSQIRRAATSIPSNIAEGYGRESRGDYVRFLRIAQGSTKELETQLIIAKEVEIVSEAAIEQPSNIADEIGRMLRAMIRKLE